MQNEASLNQHANRILHIVDDNAVTRRRIREVVERTLSAINLNVQVREWKFVWDLLGATHHYSLRGDVAICDLFSMKYRTASPNIPLAGNRPDTAPGSIEDIKWASLDSVLNYFKDVVQQGITIIVYSHVPLVLSEHDETDAANELVSSLLSVGVREKDIVAKPTMEAEAEQLVVVADRVRKYLSGASPE